MHKMIGGKYAACEQAQEWGTPVSMIRAIINESINFTSSIRSLQTYTINALVAQSINTFLIIYHTSIHSPYAGRSG